jgi:hypothetical protein
MKTKKLIIQNTARCPIEIRGDVSYFMPGLVGLDDKR